MTLIDSNIKDINLEDKSVDTILIVGGLHHMTDFDEIFRVFKKVAKPGANLSGNRATERKSIDSITQKN